MTTPAYLITFKDGKKCVCKTTEPATDAENIESIKAGFCGKVLSVELMRANNDEPHRQQD